MPTLDTAATTVLKRADRLAACSEDGERLTRRFATAALAEGGELVSEWMRAAGMAGRRDAIGNVVGRWEPAGGRAAGTLLMGSHIDTVVDAGRYDGMLGVLVALACVERLPDDLPFAVEVYAFADEEGVRYGTAYLGSSVVTGIAGQTRAEVVFAGEAGHAGTVPMALRRDALVAAAELVAACDALARATDGLVATVGELAVQPGASNVIPARATLSLDVRHLDDAVRAAAVGGLRTRASEIAAARGGGAGGRPVQETDAVACSRALMAELEAAVDDAGVRVARLPSGAGHDAAVMSRLCDVAMLFVRCAGGISHNPAEAVTAEDVAVAIDVAGRLVDTLAH